MRMGRNPIIRNAVIQVLKKTGSARFSEILKEVKKQLKREKLRNKPLVSALTFLIQNGLVEKKINGSGQIVYTLTKTYFEKQLQNILKKLLEEMDDMDFYYKLADEETPTFAFYRKWAPKNYPLKLEGGIPCGIGLTLMYNPLFYANWATPAKVIVERMKMTLQDYNNEVVEGISNLLAYAYWIGVQDCIASFGHRPIQKVIEELKNFSKQILEKAEKMGETNSRRVRVEKLLIQILVLTEELISKNNLKDFFDFLFKKTLVIKQLQTEMLNTYRLPGGGEYIWDLFINYHEMVIRGLERAKINVENGYLLGCSDIWNKFIKYFLYPPKDEWGNIKGSVEENITKLEEYADEYLKYLVTLPEKSKMIITYVWGYPEILETSKKAFLPRFEEWYLALKKGFLDHRGWLFSEEARSIIINTAKKVKRGIPPDPIKIDPPESWTLKDLYDFHPRGKDPAFWEDFLHEIEKRSGKRDD